MKINEFKINDITVLQIDGNIMGGQTSESLLEKVHDLVNRKIYKVIMDLENVRWMNSSGLGIIMGTLTTLRSRDGDLKLIHPNEKVKSLLKITQLSKIIETFDDLQMAIKNFESSH